MPLFDLMGREVSGKRLRKEQECYLLHLKPTLTAGYTVPELEITIYWSPYPEKFQVAWDSKTKDCVCKEPDVFPFSEDVKDGQMFPRD